MAGNARPAIRCYSLKVVVAVRSIMAARCHAAGLETGAPNRMGTSRCDRLLAQFHFAMDETPAALNAGFRGE